MNKRAYIEIVRKRLTGGNDTPDLLGKYHPEVVAKNVSIAMNSVFFDLFRSNESLLDLYTKTYTATLTEQSSLNAYYATLPAPIVQLPRNTGIRLITPQEDQSTAIPLVSSRAQASFAKLEVNTLSGEMYAYLAGEDIYVVNKRVDVNVLLLKLVVPFDEYAWTDNIYIPSGKGEEILQLVQNLMLNMPPEDFRNDNNSERP